MYIKCVLHVCGCMGLESASTKLRVDVWERASLLFTISKAMHSLL